MWHSFPLRCIGLWTQTPFACLSIHFICGLTQHIKGLVQVRQHFGDKVYRTVIPRNVRLAEAPSHGMPVLTLDRQSKGALAYLALAGEMLSKPVREIHG